MKVPLFYQKMRRNVPENMLSCWGKTHVARRPPQQFSTPPLGLVPRASAAAAVAQNARSLQNPGLGNHAPADPGGPGGAEVQRIPAALPDPSSARPGEDGPVAPRVVPAGLQRPPAAAAADRPADASRASGTHPGLV